MDVQINRELEAERIRALIDGWAQAARAGDIEGLLAHHHPDLVAFDCHSQMQFQGLAAFGSHVEACFSSMQGSMSIEIRDLEITAGDRVAFSRYFARCGGTAADGTQQHCWLRVTLGLIKSGGEWSLVHVHCSAPFDPATGQALLDLQVEADAG